MDERSIKDGCDLMTDRLKMVPPPPPPGAGLVPPHRHLAGRRTVDIQRQVRFLCADIRGHRMSRNASGRGVRVDGTL
ncbi:hypothetical protein PAXINDRAFT_169787 [Paxillus involutus ATCC 200175]|uniref:Uncharacterized protein n=1 Tax=Paxillus involutus ATCC 200175 TaxID=664439 RepID=A0A0C9TVS3_PAXIN|nr:hypothetical protein PAXINDRAFT_169787 [Paxillus involutus ATCC 200175]